MRQQAIKLTFTAAMLAIGACSQDGVHDLNDFPKPVMSMTVTTQASEGLRAFPGSLRARERAELSFELGGIVARLDVDIGDQFKQGEVLAQLDDQLIRLDLDQSEADLVEARATLAEAERDYRRRSELALSGAISRADLDTAIAALDRAKARVTSLVARVNSARKRLEDTRIIAPYDGEVSARHVEPLHTVQTGQAILSVVGSHAGMEAVFYLPERLRYRFHSGSAVSVAIKSSGARISGTVTQIGASLNSAGLYPVTVAVDNQDKISLSQGMMVDITAKHDPEAEPKAFVIPLTALIATANGEPSAVYVIDPENARLIRTPVQVGRITANGVVIDAGLQAGDVIVSRGVDFLNEGRLVEPMDYRAEVARFNP